MTCMLFRGRFRARLPRTSASSVQHRPAHWEDAPRSGGSGQLQTFMTAFGISECERRERKERKEGEGEEKREPLGEAAI